MFKLIFRHKFIAGTILLLIIGSGYFVCIKIFSNNDAVRYATAQVQKGTLTISISGSGQTSISNQTDIKSKVSADIVYIGVKMDKK